MSEKEQGVIEWLEDQIKLQDQFLKQEEPKLKMLEAQLKIVQKCDDPEDSLLELKVEGEVATQRNLVLGIYSERSRLLDRLDALEKCITGPSDE